MPRAKKAMIAAVALSLVGGFRYITQTIDGVIQPTMTTWLLFAVAVSLSMWTYLATEKHSMLTNIGNTIDLVFCWIELFAIVFVSPHPRLGLNFFEVCCIAAALLIGYGWRRTRKHVLANLAIQGIMVVAYLPTLYGLWYATTNHESLSAWSIQWLVCACALVTAIEKRDRLAMIYAGRAVTFVSLMLFLMIRIELR